MKTALRAGLILLFFLPLIQSGLAQDPDPGIQIEAFEGDGDRPVFVDSTGRFIIPADQATDTVYDSPSLPIPEDDCAGVLDSIVVSGFPTEIASPGIRLNLDITHTYNGDLLIYLIAPNADTLNIASRNGLSSDNYVNVTFSDFGDLTLGYSPIVDNGHYKPAGNQDNICTSPVQTAGTFGAFGGGIINPNGVWYLWIIDKAGGDLGTLNNWSIIINEHYGVQNYLVKWDADAPLGQARKSSVYDNGNVGIGTDLPTAKLDVNGQASFREDVGIGTNAPTAKLDVNGQARFRENVGIGTVTPTARLDVDGQTRLRQQVGIGTNAPSEMLDVNGQIRIRGGSPNPGDQLTATGTDGTATWSHPGAQLVYAEGSTLDFTNDDNYHSITGWTGSLYLSSSDIVTIRANTYLRLLGGSGPDPFTVRVVVQGQGACNSVTSYEYNGDFIPPEGNNDHDNPFPVSFMEITNVGSCTGNYQFLLQARNSGDDSWRSAHSKLIVRKN